MRHLLSISIAAVAFTACAAPAGNRQGRDANANSDANAAKPVAVAPTADALIALDKQANEAYIKGDRKFFDGFLSDKLVMQEGWISLQQN